MELDSISSGYSSCSSSTLGYKKWQYNKMQEVDCTTMPQCSTYTNAFKYYNVRYNRQWKDDANTTMERIERQKLLNRKRRRTRQQNFESARSNEETGTEYASSSETTSDADGFVYATNVVMEEQVDFTDDDLIMAEESLAGTQIEDSAYRIEIPPMYSPESLIDMELESELSESEPSFLDSESDTEREEDGYLTSEFFEDEPDSDTDNEDSLTSLVKFVGEGTEIVRHRFPFLSIRIFLSDFTCLMNDEFVNDTIVDFCLNHLIFNVLPEDLYKIHALPSIFWYVMQLAAIEDPSYKKDSLTEKLMRRYSRLAGFIENVDLFEQDFVVLPINSLNHWSLAMICCPNKLTVENKNEQSNVLNSKPCILMFDSQPSNRQALEKYGMQMREFLQFAYTYQNGYSEDLAERFSDQNCPIIMPKLPRQSNQFDCGIHVLEFAKHFLSNPPNMLKVSEDTFDFLNEYPTFNVSRKRASLRDEILSMSKDKFHFEQLLGFRSD